MSSIPDLIYLGIAPSPMGIVYADFNAGQLFQQLQVVFPVDVTAWEVLKGIYRTNSVE